MWRRIRDDEIETTIKKNFIKPVSYIPQKSCVPDHYKLASVFGEYLRFSRICSTEKLLQLNLDCLVQELCSVGYTKQKVLTKLRECKARIADCYDEDYKKKQKRVMSKRLVYGANMPYNQKYPVHEIVMKYIGERRPQDVSNISLVPSDKIMKLAYTKRQYLEKQNKTKLI